MKPSVMATLAAAASLSVTHTSDPVYVHGRYISPEEKAEAEKRRKERKAERQRKRRGRR